MMVLGKSYASHLIRTSDLYKSGVSLNYAFHCYKSVFPFHACVLNDVYNEQFHCIFICIPIMIIHYFLQCEEMSVLDGLSACPALLF